MKKFIARGFSQTLLLSNDCCIATYYYLLGGIVQVFTDQIKVKYGFLTGVAFADIGNRRLISLVFTKDSREFRNIGRQEHEVIKGVVSISIFFQPFSRCAGFSQDDDSFGGRNIFFKRM
jgi:hypothetical protein